MGEKDGKKKLTSQPVTEVNWDGAMAKHSCTDIPCLILFVVFLLGWGGVGIYAMMNGNIDTVICKLKVLRFIRYFLFPIILNRLSFYLEFNFAGSLSSRYVRKNLRNWCHGEEEISFVL